LERRQASGHHRHDVFPLPHWFDGRRWLELSATEKNLFAQTIPGEVPPLRLASLEELEALLEINRNIPPQNIERLRKRGIPESDLGGYKMKRQSFNAIEVKGLSGILRNIQPNDWRKGCSILALTVDFAHYNDKEISDAFKILLGLARPPEFATPKRSSLVAKARGRSHKAWRVSLERLAVARLVQHYGPFPEKFPESARTDYSCRVYYRHKRELEAAEKFFHKLFPFLQGERMLCRQKMLSSN